MALYQGLAPTDYVLRSFTVEEQRGTPRSPFSLAANPPHQSVLPPIEGTYYQPSIGHSHVTTSQPNRDDCLSEVQQLLSHASLHQVEMILLYLKASHDLSNELVTGQRDMTSNEEDMEIDSHSIRQISTFGHSLPAAPLPRFSDSLRQPMHAVDHFNRPSEPRYFNETGTSSNADLGDNTTNSCQQIYDTYGSTGSMLMPNRDSIRSINSYNSTNTNWTMRSKHSSTSTVATVGSRASISSVRPPQRTMSSKTGPTVNTRTRHSASSIRIACSYAETEGCLSTFTREDSRARHENQMHCQRLRYTCLLDTCTSSCSEDCQEEYHIKPFSHTRADKFRTEHLEKVHDWGISKGEIPASWQGAFVHDKSGWTCRGCGFELGTWHDNADGIESHFKICGEDEDEEIQRSFKRLSVEGTGALIGQELLPDEEDVVEQEDHNWGKEKYWG